MHTPVPNDDDLGSLVDRLETLKEQLETAKLDANQKGTADQSEVKRIASLAGARDKFYTEATKTQPDLRKKRAAAETEKPAAMADLQKMSDTLKTQYGFGQDPEWLGRLVALVKRLDDEIEALKDTVETKTWDKAEADAALEQAKIVEKRAEARLNTSKGKLMDLPKTIQTKLDAVTALRTNARTALEEGRLIDTYIYLSDLRRNLGTDYATSNKESLTHLIAKQYEAELIHAVYGGDKSAWSEYQKAVQGTADATAAVDRIKFELSEADAQLKELTKDRDNRIKAWYNEHKDDKPRKPAPAHSASATSQASQDTNTANESGEEY